MVERLTKDRCEVKDHLGDLHLIEFNPEEKSHIKRVSEIISSCSQELIDEWADDFFNHLSSQKDIPLENVMKDPENLSLQAHFISLVHDFFEYLMKGDIKGFVRSNAELGTMMAKENLPFERIVIAFYFLEDAYDSLLIRHFTDNTKIVIYIKTLDRVLRNTLATIAKVYFNEKNCKINLLKDSRKKMVLGLVHDVRDKLAFGRTLPDLYRSGIFRKNPEKLGYYMDMLKEIMEEAIEVINDALDYNHIIDGSYQLNRETTDLMDVVQKIVEPFVPLLDSENKKLYINGIRYTGRPISGDILADVDLKQITRVFGNLFSNALKYTKDEIRFVIDDRDTQIYCSVQDNGMGIPEENQKRIFNPGIAVVQVSGDQIDINRSVGIDTVKKIVELHDGTIDIKSVPNQGTLFYFILPKRMGI